jgi:hypothetical protein
MFLGLVSLVSAWQSPRWVITINGGLVITMLRCMEGGRWGKGSGFKELKSECSDTVDMMTLSEKQFVCENGVRYLLLGNHMTILLIYIF